MHYSGAMLRPPSLRLLIGLIVVLPIVVIAVVLVLVSSMANRQIAENLGRSLVDSATSRVSSEVTRYLSDAMRVSEVYAARVRDGRLSAQGLTTWETSMLEDLRTTPSVASICFGSPSGESTWLLRGKGGRLEVGRVQAGKNDAAEEFEMDVSGSVGTELLRPPYSYDPSKRPWYTLAQSSNKPTWTPVYFWFSEQGGEAATGTGFTRQVQNAAGSVLGVLVIDVTLAGMSDYLRSLPLAREGAVFIVDDADKVVAASEGSVVGDKGQRIGLHEVASDAAKSVSAALLGGGKEQLADGQFRVLLRQSAEASKQQGRQAAEYARVRVAPIASAPGLQWRVITVLPEATFLGEAHATQRRSIWVGAAVAFGALVLGLGLARTLTKPMVKLSTHVRRVGQGDFDARLDLREARELQQLSGDLNQMSLDLKKRIELERSLEIAVQVQQSLLPSTDPHVPGLDVAGRSNYCDAAGGDYYDFVDISQAGKGSVLLVVGDVMGHGISAALLMASARAALRARIADRPNLADVLTTVNHVLAKDARHNQFMTMSLVAITPPPLGQGHELGTMRWANAGHDATLIYHPSSDSFDEFEDGGVPMGLEENFVYEEYERACLQHGDVLCIGTDGIWEMANAAGEMFGKDRLRELMRRAHTRSASELSDMLQAELKAFRGEAPQKDDVTFVFARVE